MTIESFAASDIQYPDGQRNKETPPDEVIANGFVPPVRAADGTIIAGNKLTANHLNYILNDLYAKNAELEARIAELEAKIALLEGA